MKWRESRVPNWHLIALTALSLVAFAAAERSTHREPRPRYEQKLHAAETALLAQRVIRDEFEKRGENVDGTNDPWRTGLIGLEHTPITSDRGVLTAKILATNPNAAAAFVDILARARVKKGDRIAIGMTGSMPGWDIAILAACKAMELTPVIITSVGASDWGANRPDLTWLDMERILRTRRVFDYKSVAASLGGGGDRGRGLSPEGRELLREAIERNNVVMLSGPTLDKIIRERMRIYAAYDGGERYAAYVNIGGGVASVGGAYNNRLIPPGYSHRLAPANYPVRAVINRMSSKGIPVINLTSVRVISSRYHLPDLVTPDAPAVGEGKLYFRERFDTTATAVLTVLLAFVVFAVIRLDLRHYMRRNPRPLEAREGV